MVNFFIVVSVVGIFPVDWVDAAVSFSGGLLHALVDLGGDTFQGWTIAGQSGDVQRLKRHDTCLAWALFLHPLTSLALCRAAPLCLSHPRDLSSFSPSTVEGPMESMATSACYPLEAALGELSAKGGWR
jgi:hypothetical protein